MTVTENLGDGDLVTRARSKLIKSVARYHNFLLSSSHACPFVFRASDGSSFEKLTADRKARTSYPY